MPPSPKGTKGGTEGHTFSSSFSSFKKENQVEGPTYPNFFSHFNHRILSTSLGIISLLLKPFPHPNLVSKGFGIPVSCSAHLFEGSGDHEVPNHAAQGLFLGVEHRHSRPSRAWVVARATDLIPVNDVFKVNLSLDEDRPPDQTQKYQLHPPGQERPYQRDREGTGSESHGLKLVPEPKRGRLVFKGFYPTPVSKTIIGTGRGSKLGMAVT
ncbi:hypothetical protein IE53DRAFT_76652 [Violaceomyces palustris]|uniref:Uncharacterized protein n=1 Tax=Violaceomyces palustris TaxID=1673888 RepID=A0ACD0P7C5_9BASI|nr:hypothetical protein IE53DRAFT_76652 [Violaceomyces palustris]